MLASRRKPLVLLLLLLALLAPPVAVATQESASSQVALTWRDRLVLEEMNRIRAAHGLAPLRIDPTLQRAALAHSKDMAAKGYFSHGDFASRLRRHGVRAARVAENIAWASGRNRARRVVRMWMNSPPHRANVLRPGFRRVGVAGVVGSIFGRRGAMVVTADFAGR
jgi:uncharacterized protein YkwD